MESRLQMPRNKEDGGVLGRELLSLAVVAQDRYLSLKATADDARKEFYETVRQANQNKVSQAVLAEWLNLSRPRIAQIAIPGLSYKQFKKVTEKRKQDRGLALAARKNGIGLKDGEAALKSEEAEKRIKAREKEDRLRAETKKEK
jgi:hypothetical protein